MFGHDEDNQGQNQNNNLTAGSAPVPDPVPDASLDGIKPVSPSLPIQPDITVPTLPATPAFSPTALNNKDDLIGIKQQALQQLSPLVSHLEQTPEEKFRTTMMMIQASDDQSLIKAAYESAKQITDEKARAQALLDVVNEINYFTQQHNK